MSAQPSLLPIIPIDSGEARNLDISIALKKIYYQPIGYQRNAKKLFEASIKAGYDFTIDEVNDWLERQAVHQIHKPRPRYIPYASFSSITIPNEVHQADVLYMPYDKVGRVTYLFCLNIVDVASRYKASVPIGAYSVKDREGILTSKTIARAFKSIYDDESHPLVWPKLLITDRGSEFKGECEVLMMEHNVKIQKAKSKRTMGIVERYNQTLAKRLFRIQDAHDLLTLHLSERSRSWVQNLPIIVEDINNSITRQIGISPAKAIKKNQVKAKPSWPARRSIGYDEAILPSYTEVRYLFEPSDLEGGKKRATDCNWSLEVFIIESYLLKENQPVLYKLYNGPERSFVREELQIVKDVQLPPQWILKH